MSRAKSRGNTSSVAASPTQTSVLQPRARVFLEQSLGERLRGGMWAIIWHTVFRFSPPFMTLWRILLLRLFGARLGQGVFIAPSARILFPWNLNIEDGAHVAHGVIINCMGEVRIGRESRISQYAHICAGTHQHDHVQMPILRSPIRIGARCWIAADAFVGPNVTIGANSVLAARSSAFGDLPADHVCVGEPARAVKRREAETDHALRQPSGPAPDPSFG